MRGFIRWPLLFLSASGIVGLSLWSPAFVQSQATVPASQFRQAAAEVGISPESLIVSGAHALAQATLSELESAGDEYTAIAQVRQQISTASATHEDLRRRLSLDPENQELLAQFNASTTQLAQLQQQLSDAQSDLAEVVLQGWTTPQRQNLEVWKSSFGRRVPAEFRVANRTEAQWHAIELAFIAEQRATQLGRELNPEQQQLLDSVRAEVEVITAQQALQLHLATLELAFQAVVTE